MKKLIVIVMIGLSILIYSKIDTEELLIPDEAIRFRVIANSNSVDDQNTKILVKNKIEKEIATDLKNSTNINTSRKILSRNTDKYSLLVENTLRENNISQEYKVNYGLNYFPEKTYKGITYKAGNYESLVVTLGEGKRDNWWCVLFPPLCLLEGEETNTNQVEYKSYVKELIDKYFK